MTDNNTIAAITTTASAGALIFGGYYLVRTAVRHLDRVLTASAEEQKTNPHTACLPKTVNPMIVGGFALLGVAGTAFLLTAFHQIHPHSSE